MAPEDCARLLEGSGERDGLGQLPARLVHQVEVEGGDARAKAGGPGDCGSVAFRGRNSQVSVI